MGMSVDFHTSRYTELNVKTRLVEGSVTGIIPVQTYSTVTLSTIHGTVNIYPSFDQVKQIYDELGKLLNDIEQFKAKSE